MVGQDRPTAFHQTGSSVAGACYDKGIKVYLFLAFFFPNDGLLDPKPSEIQAIFFVSAVARFSLFTYLPRPLDFSSGSAFCLFFSSKSVFLVQEGHVLSSVFFLLRLLK